MTRYTEFKLSGVMLFELTDLRSMIHRIIALLLLQTMIDGSHRQLIPR